MKYKKFITLILFIVFLSFSSIVFAADTNELTSEEYDYLINQVGQTKEEVESLPIEVARELIENEAVLQDSVVSYENIESENDRSFDDILQPFGVIPASDIRISGAAYKVNSDRSGFDKFYFYGNFEWLKTPFFTLVDKMTIGFPASAGFSLPISSGKVQQHQHRYCRDPYGNGNWSCNAIKRTVGTNDWEPNAGVAGTFDLKLMGDWTKHKGFVSQYVYVPIANNGELNIKLQYGHKRISGSASVGIKPTGLGINITSTTDYRSYGLSVRY